MSTDCEQCVIEEVVLPVSKDAFEGVGILAGIDRGCSLTKAMFSTKSDNANMYNLHFALFHNKDFTAALRYMKKCGMIVQDGQAKLHVTGVGGDRHKRDVKEILGVETQFIEEFLTQGGGTRWLLRNIPEETLCHPDPELDWESLRVMQRNRFVASLGISWQLAMRNCSRQEAIFPCILVVVGSGGAILKLSSDGSTEMLGTLWLAGTTFMGLAKLLLDTNDYDEVMRLAELGERSKVDLQVKDVLENDPDSPYGQLPHELGIFSMGKAAYSDRSASSFAREDLAHSLVYAYTNNVLRAVLMSCRVAGTCRIYCGGNFFRHQLVRQEVFRAAALYCRDIARVKFLRTGHTGAVGAAVSKPEDVQRFLAHAAAAVEAANATK